MKKSIAFIFLVCAFATCQESNQSTSQRTQALREVGGRITNDEAARWRQRYESSPTSSREQSVPAISKATLQQAVTAIQDYDGLYFHHALEGDRHHVLVIPYKDGQSIWAGTVVLDANADATMDVATASLWAGIYMGEHPEGPWSHFFGRHVFETILANEDFDKMEIVRAANDAGEAQLLLYVSYGTLATSGRTQGEVEVYDHSNQCPPFCPGGTN